MHMVDALLSPAAGATFWTGTIATIGYCSRKLRDRMNERLLPLMGVMGAFVFATQMINFTIPGTGSSGHIGGGMLLAILLGPHAGFLTIAAVLSVQALFFADGGILALGSNIWNLGVYPCFIAYLLIFKPLAGDGSSSGRVTIAAIVAAVVGLQLGAFSVVLQTCFSGRSELPFTSFLLLMQPVHLAIGVVEGVATAGVINFVKSEKPELLPNLNNAASMDFSYKKVLASLFILALLIGGIGAWFASEKPDGLEWSLEKAAGSPELSGREGIAYRISSRMQEKTSFLPGYGFKGTPHEHAGIVNTGTTVSGLAGSLMVLAIVFVLGIFLKRQGRKSCSLKKNGY